jgi:hypothetical protein
MIFTSVLSNLTPSMRSLYYKSGISAGRTLYRKYQMERRHMWYGESVSDLVAFLEKSGFERITYNVFPDMPEIRFNKGRKGHLAMNLHTFEAGIISGFLTAARQQQTVVNEVSCIGNGSDFCNFTNSDAIQNEIGAREAIERLVDGLSQCLLDRNREMAAPQFLEEYHMLSSEMLLGGEYAKEINLVVYRVAQELAKRLGRKAQRADYLARAAEHIFGLLDLSKLKVSSIRPLKAEMRFPVLKAKKEFVDISITFLGGFLSGAIGEGSNIRTTSAMSNGSYTVRIRERGRKE